MAGNDIRVMLVDDHAMVRAGLRTLLEKSPGITVVADLDSGRDILAMLERYRPDILVLDMEMPDRAGPDVAREIIAANAPVKILALSAYDDIVYIQKMLDMGAAGYLNKEESAAVLVEAVCGIARGEHGWFSRSSMAVLSNVRRFGLSPRERAVLGLIAQAASLPEIAKELGVSLSTVKTHAQHIYQKIGVENLREAYRWAWRHGFD